MYMYSILILLTLGVCQGYVTNEIVQDCNRISSSASCYYIDDGSYSGFAAAVSACRSEYNGHLATFESHQEWQDIANLMINGGAIRRHYNSEKQYYVGGLTVDKHQTFIWYHSGQEVSQSDTMWAEGEPNDWHDLGENCVLMDPRMNLGRNGGLNDASCTTGGMGFICEVE